MNEQPYTVKAKIIVSGSYLEHYDYEYSYIKGMPRIKTTRRLNIVKSKTDQTQIRDDNVRRTRKKIRRLVNCNHDLTKFMTLTFNSPKLDLNETNPLFRQFIKRITRRYPDFKYLCVPEFQHKSRRVHYHLLCNLPFIDNKALVALWGQGFVFIRKIDNIDNVGAYICKYLGKANFDTRYFRKNKFFYSYNLLRPIIIDKYNEVIHILHNLPTTIPSLCKKLFNIEVYTKYLGTLKYSQYKIYPHFKFVPT